MSTGAIRAGKAFVEVFAKDATQRGLDQISNRFKSFGAGVAATGLAIQAAALAGFASLGAAVNSFLGAGDELTKAADRTGILVAQLSALKYAAEQSDVSFTSLQSGIRKMQQVLAKSGELSGMSPDKQFAAIADAIRKIDDPTLRAAAAIKYFGRAGIVLMPLLKEGADGLKALQDRAEKLGLIVNPDDAANATKLGDSIADVTKQFRMMAFAVGAALAEPLQVLVDLFHPFGKALIDIVKANPGFVRGMAVAGLVLFGIGTAAVVAGVALVTIGSIIGAVSTILAAIPAIIAGVSAAFAFLASPIGLVVATVGALLVSLPLLAYAFDQAVLGGLGLRTITGYFAELWKVGSTTIRGIYDAIAMGDWKGAANIAGVGINAGFTTAWGMLKIGFIEFFSWLTQGFIDFFGQELIGIVTGGLSKVVELINAGAKALGVSNQLIDGSGLAAAAKSAQAGNLKKDVAAASDAATAEIRKEIADAQALLNTLTAQAAADRVQEQAAAAAVAEVSLPLPQTSIGQQTKATGSSSAAAISRIASSQPVFDEMEKQLVAQTDLLTTIAENTEDLGPEFGD